MKLLIISIVVFLVCIGTYFLSKPDEEKVVRQDTTLRDRVHAACEEKGFTFEDWEASGKDYVMVTCSSTRYSEITHNDYAVLVPR